MQLTRRVLIECVTPAVDGGRYAVKAIVGDRVAVAADVLREGHELLAAVLQYRRAADDGWREEPFTLDDNDRWRGSFSVDALGAWRYRILAWTDHYASWLQGILKKQAAGVGGLEADLADGAQLLQRRSAPPEVERTLARIASLLTGSDPVDERIAAAADPALLRLLTAQPERLDATASEDFPLWVDREAARFSAWYELFVRSEGATSETSGTFADAAKRLPAIARMGFDVVYLPPIHPIGRAFRKGPNNSLPARATDPGVPWAIGSAEGGHTSVHPDLGTIDDFDAFVAQARHHGLEIALDYAIQCSPDHPWTQEHPEWFKQRADGTIHYAENPPKRYQDIYPIDFDTPEYEKLTYELKGILEFWIGHGVRIFRVDNPHTKPLPFWRWLITEIHAQYPDVLFLAEAFTRPKIMAALAKVGFTQSYTYFTWRNTKQELTDYVTELAHTESADFFRPNFWPNTPDILTEYLQTGGRPAFKIRLLLAALLSPAYGIYSGYELYEHKAVAPGSEEYLDSEKYQYKPRDWNRPESLAPFITRLNRIRRAHEVFRLLRNVWFHEVHNDRLLCFSKVEPGGGNPILVVVNLDPHAAAEATIWLDLPRLGLEGAGPFEARDLLTDTTYLWHGPQNYVRLDPAVEPAHVLRLRRR